jgi:hypothetical protein
LGRESHWSTWQPNHFFGVLLLPLMAIVDEWCVGNVAMLKETLVGNFGVFKVKW